MAAPVVKLMRAVQYDSYGGGAAGLKHVEVPIPSPKKDEVLLKLGASSINPFDWKIQKGMLRPFLPRRFPFVPVTDVAGEVVEVGLGVSSLKPGDRVVTILGIQQSGGLAEYVATPTKLVVKLPTEVSSTEAVGLPIAGLTALQTLQSAGIKFDGTNNPVNILITAASGGVGHYAVQLAKLGNSHVTATCGARNVDLVKSLGANEVLDYKTPAGATLQSPSGKKYDAVIHCTAGIPWSTFDPNLAENGKVINTTPNATAFLTAAIKKITFSKKQLIPFLVSAKKDELEFLVGLVKKGKLKTIVNSRHPLSQAEVAWAKSIEGHATGKIIVENAS